MKHTIAGRSLVATAVIVCFAAACQGSPAPAGGSASVASSTASAAVATSVATTASAPSTKPRIPVSARKPKPTVDPAADAVENDISEADDYARSFAVEQSTEPEEPANVGDPSAADAISPFPFTCSDCEIGEDKPITNLIDDKLVAAVREYDCAKGTDHEFVPFFPGIQGFNNGRLPGLRTRLGGDRATADLYVKYALRATRADSKSDIGAWSLLFYYNVPKVSEDAPSSPVFLEPPTGAAAKRGVRVLARSNHSTYRLKDWGSDWAREGDQMEARLLGIWASTPNDQDFIDKKPDFSGTGDFAERDAYDFSDFTESYIPDPGFRDFMYRSAYEVAVAFKCDQPVFAHSGGGAVVTFLSRLLSVSPLGAEMKKWEHDFRIIGLEAVLSNEMNKRLHESLGRLVMQQFVVGDLGSKTYTNVIGAEAKECGFSVLTHQSILESVDPPGWNGDAGGHGGLGFFTLATGRLPKIPAFIKRALEAKPK